MTKCKFCKEWKKPATIMGPICGYCKRHKKNQWLLWKLYAGIARNVIKPNENPGPICGYCIEWRMSTIMGGPYAGIAGYAKNTSGYNGT